MADGEFIIKLLTMGRVNKEVSAMGSKHAGALLISLLTMGLSICVGVQRLNAQALYGSVVGTVTDQTGAVVPGARVIITNPLTGLKREADSDSAGLYNIPNLPDGAYDLSVTAQGFTTIKQTNIAVKVGSIIRIDVALQVGAVTQEVTVQATGAVLQTEKAEVTARLGTVAVVNLPTGFYRNYQFLMLLVPGAAENQGFTGALADTPERAIAVPMNGLSPSSNSTRIDGAQSTFLWKAGGAALYVPPIESIQEFKITTSSYDPEKGMAGGAAMDVITKSGTNDWHGVAFWYHFDQHLASCKPFDANCKWEAFGLTPRSKPKDILNDLGGNLGGPIKKNKLFFFANWDGVFQRNTPDDFFHVPTADIRAGNFSAYLRDNVFLADGVTPVMVPTTDGRGNIGALVQLQQGMIFDPTTGNLDGTGRAVFAAGGVINTIPTDRFVPTAQTILGLWPLANAAPLRIDAEGNVFQNFFLNAPQRFNRNNVDFKGDWNRSDKHLIWGKYSQMNALTKVPCGFGTGIGGPCPADSDGDVHVVVHTAAIGHTWSFSPTFLVDGTLGWSYMLHDGKPSDFGKNIGLEVLKIPGTNDPNDIRASGAPRIQVADFSQLGSPFGWLPLFRNDWSLTNSHNASWMRGKHTIRFGVDIVHHHMNHWQPENGFGPRGGLEFTRGDATMLNLSGLSTDKSLFRNRYNQFASFLLGTWDHAGRSVQYQRMSGKSWEYGFHFLDRWRATSKLTVNLGLRYEYYPWMRRDSLGKGTEQYDPDTNMVKLGGLGGNPVDLGTRTQKNMFAPRIGVAYQLNKDTVLRGGFGSTFDTRPILRALRGTYPAEVTFDFAYDTSNPVFNTPSGCANGSGPLCSYQGLGSFAGGIPPIILPDVSSGTIPIPTVAPIRFAGPGLFKRGRVETWNFFVERRLPAEFILGVGYVGNRLINSMAPLDLNASRIDEQAPLSAKWGRTAETLQLQGYVDSHYNALQVTIDRHYSKGLYIKGAYTYSKAIDLTSDAAWGGTEWMPPLFAGPGYLQHNRGMADFDHRHIFRIAYVWELPFGTGRRYANTNRIGRAVLGGWQLNGLWSSQSGSPTGLYGDNSSMRQAGNWQTLDQIGPIRKQGCLGPGTGCYWYDPSSFAPVPIDPVDGRQHRFGTAGRNIAVYGPGRWQMDASLFRHFKLGERFDLQFRAEGLNVFNHPVWNWDNSRWGNGFCWSTVGGACSGMLQSTGASGQRIIRLGLRLAF